MRSLPSPLPSAQFRETLFDAQSTQIPERQTVFTAEEIKMLAVLYVAIKVRVATQGVVLGYGVELRSGDNVGHTYSCGASNNLSVNL